MPPPGIGKGHWVPGLLARFWKVNFHSPDRPPAGPQSTIHPTRLRYRLGFRASSRARFCCSTNFATSRALFDVPAAADAQKDLAIDLKPTIIKTWPRRRPEWRVRDSRNGFNKCFTGPKTKNVAFAADMFKAIFQRSAEPDRGTEPRTGSEHGSDPHVRF
jgi:hypothetical protein